MDSLIRVWLTTNVMSACPGLEVEVSSINPSGEIMWCDLSDRFFSIQIKSLYVFQND